MAFQMIYVSTGGFSNISGLEAAARLRNVGVDNIEFSGGSFVCTIEQDLAAFERVSNCAIHNYFPVPEIPFVLNLASVNLDIHSKTKKHITDSIRLAGSLGQRYYSFHAGFLMDPRPTMLGKRISKAELVDRQHALKKFIDSVADLAVFAKDHGLQLMIENNVLSNNNLKEFNDNPFLMADAAECLYVMEALEGRVGFLLDVAHLNVSANSLGFDKLDFIKKLDKHIMGLHLSENNGLADQNKMLSKDAWFWGKVPHGLDYVSIEVYGLPFEFYPDQVELSYTKLNLSR